MTPRSLLATLALTLSPAFVAPAFAAPPAAKAAPPAADKAAANAPAAPAPLCYELSADGKGWSRTPEVICVASDGPHYTFTLRTGMLQETQDVAVFHLQEISKARCIDCNVATYGLTNPSNSVFNNLKISFAGQRDPKTGAESGTVSIGATKLFYRRK